MSFINYTPQGSGYFADMANSQFVGLDWFKYFFSTDFTKIMRNTLATSLLTLLFFRRRHQQSVKIPRINR